MRVAAIIGSSVAGAALILAVAEIALTWSGYDGGLRSRHATVSLRAHSPNQDRMLSWGPPYSVESRDGQPRPVRFRTDANGFILPSAARDDAVVVIAFLGGSSTANRWVSEESRFAGLSARILSDRLGVRVAAWNAGYQANTTSDSITLLLHKIGPMRPDFVVLMQGSNDVYRLFSNGAYQGVMALPVTAPRIGPLAAHHWVMSDLLPNVTGLVRRKINALRLAVDHQGIVERVLSGSWYERQRAAGRTDPELVDELARIHRATLELFLALCRHANARPVLMTQANRFVNAEEPEPQAAERYELHRRSIAFRAALLDAHQRAIRSVAEENQVPLVDLETGIPGTSEYLTDAVHMTDRGAKRAALMIADALEPAVSALLGQRGRQARAD